MLILGIDTTGFSTSIALIKDGKEVLFHKKISFGVTSRRTWDDFVIILPAHHQKFLIGNIAPLFKKGMNISAIAVSAGSGIFNCVLVGVSVAKTLAFCYRKPLIKVDHILAHLYSTWIERNMDDFQFPILVFSASGSHTDFALIRNKKNCEIIFDVVPSVCRGKVTVFWGVGKLFYWIGRRLGIITPMDKNFNFSMRKLTRAMACGNPHKYDFSTYYKGKLLDFDFLLFIKSIDDFIVRQKSKLSKTPSQFIFDVAASFQESITEILADKIIKLAKIKKAKEIHITGGISQNNYLKKKLQVKIKEGGFAFILRYPVKREYKVDNAAMIGCLAYYQKKYRIKFKNFFPKITR